MKNLFKGFVCSVAAILLLMLTGCSDEISYESDWTYSSSSIYSNSNHDNYRDDFDTATADLTIARSELLDKMSEAQNILDTVSPSELDDSTLLEELQNSLNTAYYATESILPNIADNDSEILAQISEITLLTGEFRNMTTELSSVINQISYSQQQYIDTHKSNIILCNIPYDYSNNVNIISVNPENGEKTKLSSFKLYQRVTSNSTGREWWNFLSNVGLSKYAPLKGIVSSDYKYLAVTRYSQDTKEYHAGWYDEDNIYYDITEFTDSVKGDFEEPVQQISIGFTDDNHFVFAEIPKENSIFIGGYHTSAPEWKVYQVDISTKKSKVKNSMEPYDDIANLQGDGWDWLGKNCEVTDWVDDDYCIINYPEEIVNSLSGPIIKRWGVYLFDKNTSEKISLIPGEVRTNWSGVVSPDGKSVAFLSAGKSEDAAIYSVPIDGGTPVKLCDGISTGRNAQSNVPSRVNDNGGVYGKGGYSFLLDWT